MSVTYFKQFFTRLCVCVSGKESDFKNVVKFEEFHCTNELFVLSCNFSINLK